MAHGLKIRNNGNFVVIDQNYSNLGLRQKIRYVQNTANSHREYRLVFTVDCTRSGVLAFRSLSDFTGVVWYTQISDTQKTVTLSSYSPVTLDVYVFDNPVYAVKKGTVGLRIKNPATGQWTFDSRCRYMKILGYVTAAFFTEQVFAGGSRLPAAIPVQHYRHDFVGVDENGGDNLQILCTGNNLRVKLDEWTYRTSGSGSGEFESGTGLVMVVDVTGF